MTAILFHRMTKDKDMHCNGCDLKMIQLLFQQDTAYMSRLFDMAMMYCMIYVGDFAHEIILSSKIWLGKGRRDCRSHGEYHKNECLSVLLLVG